MASQSLSQAPPEEQPPTVELLDPSTGEVLTLRNGAPAVRGQWSRVALSLPADLPFEEWQQVGTTLRAIEGSVLWWLGDWCNYGEAHYHEKYSQALEDTDYDRGTVKNASYVAQNVSSSRRRDDLSFAHHYEVAALSEREQVRWLEIAASKGWSHKDLRRAIKHARRIESDARAAAALDERAVVVEADAFAWLATVPAGAADLLLTDPPYATDVEDIGAFSRAWLAPAFATLAPHGRAYIFTGAYPHELHAYLEAIAETKPAGWTLDNVLVWTYRNTLGPAPSHSYKLNWQACFYLYGPDAPALQCPLMVEQFTVMDVAAPDGRHEDGRLHPWQKPDELADRLIRHSTTPGQTVIDPFAGTGTFLVSAMRLGRRAIGSDMDPQQVAMCEARGCRRA